jgi:hypothetical protein
MCTYKSVTKQRTLTTFRINTYEKSRGDGSPTIFPFYSLSRFPRLTRAKRLTALATPPKMNFAIGISIQSIFTLNEPRSADSHV